ncbi:unnamed protein product [Urochloa humidicola]
MLTLNTSAPTSVPNLRRHIRLDSLRSPPKAQRSLLCPILAAAAPSAPSSPPPLPPPPTKPSLPPPPNQRLQSRVCSLPPPPFDSPPLPRRLARPPHPPPPPPLPWRDGAAPARSRSRERRRRRSRRLWMRRPGGGGSPATPRRLVHGRQGASTARSPQAATPSSASGSEPLQAPRPAPGHGGQAGARSGRGGPRFGRRGPRVGIKDLQVLPHGCVCNSYLIQWQILHDLWFCTRSLARCSP